MNTSACFRFLCTILFAIAAYFNSFASCWTDSGNYDISWYLDNSDASEYELSDAAQLAGVAYLVNQGITSFDGVTLKITAPMYLGRHVWEPIGTESRPFKGNVNGQCYGIVGLDISDMPSCYYNGLFGYVSGGTFKHIYFDGGSINYTRTFSHGDMEIYIGMLAGYAINCSFYNITDEFTYESILCDTSGCGAGVVCHIVGGLVGYSVSSQYSFCSTSRNITCKLGYNGSREYHERGSHIVAGGLIGINNARDNRSCIEFCYSSSDIHAYYKHSVNTNNTSSSIGGLVGYQSGKTTIKYCYSKGDISTLDLVGWNRNVGGIVGNSSMNSTDGIFNCYYSGDINAGSCVKGGIAGAYRETWGDCYRMNYSLAKYKNYPGLNGSTSFSDFSTESFLNEINSMAQLDGYGRPWRSSSISPGLPSVKYVTINEANDNKAVIHELEYVVLTDNYQLSSHNLPDVFVCELPKEFVIRTIRSQFSIGDIDIKWYIPIQDNPQIDIRNIPLQEVSTSDLNTYIELSMSISDAHIVFDINAPMLSITGIPNSSIPSVEVGEGSISSPTYYKLDGTRVVNPVPGNIYVEERGNNVRKIVYL